MRKWFLTIHLYGGLLCAPYLIIFGLTSIHYNHRDHGPGNFEKVAEWEEQLTVEVIKENRAQATAIRDSLGLFGNTPPPRMKRDGSGDFHFDIERPGKGYTVHASFTNKKVRVEERRKGVVQVIDSLHALGGSPNSTFVATWAIYTEICTIFTFFAAASGLYLWVNSQREPRRTACRSVPRARSPSFTPKARGIIPARPQCWNELSTNT